MVPPEIAEARPYGDEDGQDACGAALQAPWRAEALLHEDPVGGGALLVTLRRSHTTGMKSKVHPTYKTEVPRCELAGL